MKSKMVIIVTLVRWEYYCSIGGTIKKESGPTKAIFEINFYFISSKINVL